MERGKARAHTTLIYRGERGVRGGKKFSDRKKKEVSGIYRVVDTYIQGLTFEGRKIKPCCNLKKGRGGANKGGGVYLPRRLTASVASVFIAEKRGLNMQLDCQGLERNSGLGGKTRIAMLRGRGEGGKKMHLLKKRVDEMKRRRKEKNGSREETGDAKRKRKVKNLK